MQNQWTLTSKLENKKIGEQVRRKMVLHQVGKSLLEHEKRLLDLLLVGLLKEKKSLEVSKYSLNIATKSLSWQRCFYKTQEW